MDHRFFNQGSYDEIRVIWSRHGVQFKKSRTNEYASFTWAELEWIVSQREPDSESEFAW